MHIFLWSSHSFCPIFSTAKIVLCVCVPCTRNSDIVIKCLNLYLLYTASRISQNSAKYIINHSLCTIKHFDIRCEPWCGQIWPLATNARTSCVGHVIHTFVRILTCGVHVLWCVTLTFARILTCRVHVLWCVTHTFARILTCGVRVLWCVTHTFVRILTCGVHVLWCVTHTFVRILTCGVHMTPLLDHTEMCGNLSLTCPASITVSKNLTV